MKYRLEILKDMLEIMPLSKLERQATMDAIKSYEKMIPIKVKYKRDVYTSDEAGYCICDYEVSTVYGHNYCPNCGQMLDWQ